MSDFKVGDIVILNSGGPQMTVTDLEGRIAYTAWWDKNNSKFSRYKFPFQSIFLHYRSGGELPPLYFKEDGDNSIMSRQ